MLANGTGKARARQDGTARPTQNWRCLFLSTGELSLAEKIAADGGRVMAGQQVRLLDIPAAANEDKEDWGIVETLHGYPDPKAFVEAVESFAKANYGMASRAFIRRFQQERQETEKELHKVMRDGLDLFCPKSVDGQVKRAAKRFLLCAFAGEKAAEWGIVPWDTQEAVGAAQTCFQAWLNRRGGNGPAEEQALVKQVQRILEQSRNSQFLDVENPDDKLNQKQLGYRNKTEDGDTVYFVFPTAFADITKGFDSEWATKVLIRVGILIPDKAGTPQSRLPKAKSLGYRNKRVYKLVIPESESDE